MRLAETKCLRLTDQAGGARGNPDWKNDSGMAVHEFRIRDRSLCLEGASRDTPVRRPSWNRVDRWYSNAAVRGRDRATVGIYCSTLLSSNSRMPFSFHF